MKHKLHQIFNRNNVKVSYSCLPNVSNIIQSHNKKILSNKQPSNHAGAVALVRTISHLTEIAWKEVMCIKGRYLQTTPIYWDYRKYIQRQAI